MRWRLVLVVPAFAAVAIGIAAAADDDPVPLFTSEDLDRMFGPAPAQPSDPVDKSRPEDWRWIEEFLERQYSRIDADRQFDLSSREFEDSATLVGWPSLIYGGSSIWGGGYPAFTWSNAVGSKRAGRGRAALFHPFHGPFARTTGATRERYQLCEPDRGALNAQRSTLSRQPFGVKR